ncbi:1-phosphatidylinositol--bisphosphate phosphodiesterase [Lasallia pustulata]|nr:1-phosphatidylinositol--bisphosphate phosphodiesterase [Lasallia pustulata]
MQLPESAIGSTTPPAASAMSEVVTLNKGQGLMRRISRGAANRLTRRRRSTNQVTNRDHSSGPVVLRRRSDSKGELDTDADYADLGPDVDDEEGAERYFSNIMLGLSMDGTSTPRTLRSERGNGASTPRSARTEGGIAPIVPSILRQGTVLTKVTKKKRKTLTFVLDTDSAKVLWDPQNPSKRVYIDDIEEIRLQSDARNYREEFNIPTDFESRWFTIIYADQNRAKGRPLKTIHLIAPNQYVFDLWTSTLEDLSKYRHELMAGLAGAGQDERTLKGHWRREMTKLFGEIPRAEEAETLDFQGVESLCRSLHINCSKKLLRVKFDRADVRFSGCLTFSEFKDFVRRLKERQDVKDIYKDHLADCTQDMDVIHFFAFLQQTQGVDVELDRAHWSKVFAKFARQSKPRLPTMPDGADEFALRMDYQAFSAFLSSEYNNIYPRKIPIVKLDRPLNEYFISSSHNTYLLGRQVAGSSSTEAYIRALQRACRCVEIDCWDGQDGRPIVMHGNTMTSSVLFSDCISVIAKYAFDSSDYPLILSLEVHCNAKQQQAMVDIMIKELGEWLVTEPFMTNVSTLPSPEDLKNRILVKVKTGECLVEKDSITDASNGRRKRSFSSPFTRPQVLDNTLIPNGPSLSSPPSISPPDHTSHILLAARGSATATSMSSTTDDSDTAPGGNLRAAESPKRAKSKIIKSLGDLGVYTRGLKLHDFASPESKTFNHIFSLAERTFETLCKDQDTKAQLEKHNTRYLMRIYPSGFRMKSSNFDPLVFWRRGVQMVALNWQTYDLGMQMNEAMFASGSDKCGYVLKPKELRQLSQTQDPLSDLVEAGKSKIQKKLIRFSVDMISAQQLPHPRGSGPDESLDPYIEIEMFSAEDKAKGVAFGEGGQNASARNGMSGIGSPHRRRTTVVRNNGYNPIFNDKFKLSLETKYPSLVFVRWTVWHSQDGRNYNNTNSEPLATFTAKLSSLEQGYRHLPLYDHNGDQFLFATLFCKIKKEEPINIEREAIIIEKVGRLRQFGQAVFKRPLSVEKRMPKEEER